MTGKPPTPTHRHPSRVASPLARTNLLDRRRSSGSPPPVLPEHVPGHVGTPVVYQKARPFRAKPILNKARVVGGPKIEIIQWF